jgi:hypothetical protein
MKTENIADGKRMNQNTCEEKQDLSHLSEYCFLHFLSFPSFKFNRPFKQLITEKMKYDKKQAFLNEDFNHKSTQLN